MNTTDGMMDIVMSLPSLVLLEWLHSVVNDGVQYEWVRSGVNVNRGWDVEGSMVMMTKIPMMCLLQYLSGVYIGRDWVRRTRMGMNKTKCDTVSSDWDHG